MIVGDEDLPRPRGYGSEGGIEAYRRELISALTPGIRMVDRAIEELDPGGKWALTSFQKTFEWHIDLPVPRRSGEMPRSGGK